MKTRVIRRYCRLKHMEVVIIEEGFPGFPGMDSDEGFSWRFKKCLAMEADCYTNGCQRHQNVRLNIGD